MNKQVPSGFCLFFYDISGSYTVSNENLFKMFAMMLKILNLNLWHLQVLLVLLRQILKALILRGVQAEIWFRKIFIMSTILIEKV